MQEPENSTDDVIQQLAGAITRTGMRSPVSLILDMLSPLDFVSSQVALFVRPFMVVPRWEHYATALTNEEKWADLRRQLGGDE